MPRPLNLFRRLVALLFPEEFRAAYGSEMERTFRAQQRDARQRGAVDVVRLWADTLPGLLRTAFREHATQLRQDSAYALRMMRRTPAFTIVAVVMLGVGIGATAAVFSIVNAVLLNPLPYAEPDRLVRIYERSVKADLLHNAVSGPNVLDWQRQTTSFARIAAFRGRSGNVSGRGEPRLVRAARASASFFGVLGVRPALGRTISETEDRELARVVVISDALWRSQFGGDAGAVGASLDLDGTPFAVIGVLPRSFRFSLDAELWIPLGLYPGAAGIGSRGGHNLGVIARLAEGTTLPQAQADLARVAGALSQTYPESNTHWDAVVEPLHDSVVRDVRPLTLLLFGAVAFVLLMTCATISSLLVARASGRAREFAVRTSLGASRARIVRQLVTEAVILSAAGGAAGVGVAALLVGVARQFTGFDVPRLDEVALDMRALIVTAGISLMTGILVGLAPAIQVGRRDLHARMNEGGRSASAGRERTRLQRLLTASQVAIAVMLLVGAGLTTRSLLHLTSVDPGFRADRVLAVDVSVPAARYRTAADVVRFFERALTETSALPGVRRAALISDAPLTGGRGYWELGFSIVGQPPRPVGQGTFAYLRWVSAGYFETVGMTLRDGRLFDDRDTMDRPEAVVINNAMARRFFPGTNPLGRQLEIPGRGRGVWTIVGIVSDARQTSLSDQAEPQMYVPYSQAPVTWATLLVRSDGEPRHLARPIEEAIRRVDPQQPIANVRALGDVVAASIAPQRLTMRALVVFAVSALVLAVMGTYGVVSYAVRQRTREIAVRMAVGARSSDVLRMIVAEGVRVSAAGALAGLAGAFALARVLEELLYEVSPTDPLTFAVAALVLIAAAAMASWLPARRATRINPILALQGD
jgi:putative ABC transport system permease protein